MHHIQSEARGPARLSSLLISLRGAFFSAFPLLESLIQTFLLSLVFYFKSSPTGLLNSCVTPFLSFVNSAANSVPLKCNSYLILPLIKSFELSLHFLVNSSTTTFKKFKTLYNLIPTHPFRLTFHCSAACAGYFLPPNWTVYPALKRPMPPYLPPLCFQSLPMKSDPFFKVHLNCYFFRESSESSQFVPHNILSSRRTIRLNPSVMFINQSEPWFSSFLSPQCINAW